MDVPFLQQCNDLSQHQFQSHSFDHSSTQLRHCGHSYRKWQGGGQCLPMGKRHIVKEVSQPHQCPKI